MSRRPVEKFAVKMRLEVRPDGPVPFVDIEADGLPISFDPSLARALIEDVTGVLDAIDRWESERLAGAETTGSEPGRVGESSAR